MLPYLSDHFGNPSGGHAESRRARTAVEDAREQIAELLGADLGEVVFTAGGTEADNLAVAGAWEAGSAAPTAGRPGVLGLRTSCRPQHLPGVGPTAPAPSSGRCRPTRMGSSISTRWPRRAAPKWAWYR